ncbi:hypothetical protein [Geminocystis sp. NIES-3709]|nr:hypothetical protein [Geminocystis sp. NIES-3709]BAQ63533.1 hypothetical protein GM3709_298 [Geminocystis sp. NIES-3709]
MSDGIVPKVGDQISVEGILKYKEIVIEGEEFNEFYLQQISSEK